MDAQAAREESHELDREWRAAAESGQDPAGAVAQGLAARHVEWLRSLPGSQTPDGARLRELVQLEADQAVADQDRLAAYGGEPGGRFVRESLRIHAQRSE